MKLWGGRFSKPTDKSVEQFTSSLLLDRRLYREDIEGSLAHAKMLGAAGLMTAEEVDAICSALMDIMREIAGDEFDFDIGDEDIHMAIERALIDKVGPLGGKLHTARSRNDQVAMDMRLHLKRAIKDIAGALVELEKVLLALAEANRETVLPGYTHLQRAQPVFLAHHLLAYMAMFRRDGRRLRHCYEETDAMPLGSAALAGTALAIDRAMVAKELGFSKISENSMDAVSDRDWLLQFLSAAATIMVHLSRLAEELVVWSSAEFGFIELDDSYTTGSSIMPQKKNPDVAELIRGKSGRVFGDLTAMLTVLKGLPLTYNRDLQEDKTFMFDAIDTLAGCLPAMAGMLAGAKVDKGRMAAAAGGGFAVATDFADYLVTKGVPFRTAHETVGKLVKWCLDEGKTEPDLTLADLQKFDSRFKDDALKLVDPITSAASRNSAGGTGNESIAAQIEKAKGQIAEYEKWLGRG
ncbi:MAG: argininosuccinate lyase [Actinomycetota bacterium]|nr:argininosuccinate lyase [Actinomycetota bacterium]